MQDQSFSIKYPDENFRSQNRTGNSFEKKKGMDLFDKTRMYQFTYVVIKTKKCIALKWKNELKMKQCFYN